MVKNDRPELVSAWWRQDVEAIIQDLEDDIRQAERRRYPGGELPLTLREVYASLWVSQKLKEEGILEVTAEKFSRLVEIALEAGIGMKLVENGT